jgi:hypothetical protein
LMPTHVLNIIRLADKKKIKKERGRPQGFVNNKDAVDEPSRSARQKKAVWHGIRKTPASEKSVINVYKVMKK